MIVAGSRRSRAMMNPLRTAAAHQSAHGYAETVDGASHTTLLGLNYADAILRGVDHVSAS